MKQSCFILYSVKNSLLIVLCFECVSQALYRTFASGFGMPGMYAINTVNGMALTAGGQLGYAPVNGYAPRTLGKWTNDFSNRLNDLET